MLRKKYQQDHSHLIDELIRHNKPTAILSIKLVGLSKIANHMIYEVSLIDNGNEKTIPVIAIDATQAIARLDHYIQSGIPEVTMQWMLGSERNVPDPQRRPNRDSARDQ